MAVAHHVFVFIANERASQRLPCLATQAGSSTVSVRQLKQKGVYVQKLLQRAQPFACFFCSVSAAGGAAVFVAVERGPSSPFPHPDTGRFCRATTPSPFEVGPMTSPDGNTRDVAAREGTRGPPGRGQSSIRRFRIQELR